MSAEFKGQDPIKLAQQAERDLNSSAAKTGHGGSDSTIESGVDESATNKFPGSEVTYGSAASGAGNNRDIFQRGWRREPYHRKAVQGWRLRGPGRSRGQGCRSCAERGWP